MKATTKPEAAAVAVESDSAPRRTLRVRPTAFLWRNPCYWSGWVDGAIFAGAVCAIGMALLGVK